MGKKKLKLASEKTFIAGKNRFNLTRVRKVDFTLKFAEWYLALPKIPGDRRLDETHALKLAGKIEDGRFISDDVNIATVLVESTCEEYACNGQHTCLARTLFGSGDLQMRVQHSKYSVETIKDAAELYAQFDSPDGKRTFDQVAKPTWSAQGMLDIYRKDVLKYAANSIAFDMVGRKNNSIKTIDRDARIALPIHEEKYVQFLSELLSKMSESSHLHKSPVCCAIFQCWKKSQSASETFWTRVRDGESLTRNMPSMKLRDFLIRTAHKAGRGALEARKATFDEIYVRSIHAWNAFRRAEKAGEKPNLKNLVYHAAAKQPLAI